jgi:hypothetical protein
MLRSEVGRILHDTLFAATRSSNQAMKLTATTVRL